MKEKHLYKFGEYCLSVEDHALRRGDTIIPVTPKMFDLLLVLVQHPGRVLGKEFLLQSVWPDSFVEEGNITFNIRQLRKALDDDAQAPAYIETVPRRGYRFLAGVEEIVEGQPQTQAEVDSDPPSGGAVGLGWRRYLVPALVGAVVLFVAIGVSQLFVRTRISAAPPILSTPFASEKLSTTGTVSGAAISPDGKTVVYTNRTGSRQGVWLRQLDTGNNVPLIPQSDDDYYYLFAFAPDGGSIYFSRAKQGLQTQINIYRISILGGIPELIVSNTEGWIGISPDGDRISFVRCPRTDQEWCSLWIADSKNGMNEKKLISRGPPVRVADSQFSPDGKRIAFAAGQSRNSANDFQLFEVSIDTGEERPLTEERFFNIKSVAWVPNGPSILVTAARVQNRHFRIWQIFTEDGTAEPLTNDSEAYGILSLDRAAARLVSTQIKQDFRLNIFKLDSLPQKSYVADAGRASFARDGRVYYASNMSGNDEIWSSNSDGTEQRQLTSDPAGDGSPICSPDNKSVYFVSNRGGDAQIWKMNADGSNPVQVTHKNGGGPIFVTPDNKLLYYKHALTGKLWSVSLETGEEMLALNQARQSFAFSPDGSMVAMEERNGEGFAVAIYGVLDGRLQRKFEVPKKLPRLLEIAWMPDGKSLLYLMAGMDYDKNTVYQQAFAGGAAREVGNVGDEELSEVSGFSISPDGKSFAIVQGGWKHDAVLLTGLR